MNGEWKTVHEQGRLLKAMACMLLVLVPLALEVVGCHGGVKAVEWSELGSEKSKPKKQSKPSDKEGLRIVARSTTEVARLSADDIIRIMQRIGFSDDQILELGTDLHNALRSAGGAEVYNGKTLEMIFAVHSQQVQIQSRSRGTFLYDIAKGRFLLGSAPSDRGR
jgi:hypothetical protein